MRTEKNICGWPLKQGQPIFCSIHFLSKFSTWTLRSFDFQVILHMMVGKIDTRIDSFYVFMMKNSPFAYLLIFFILSKSNKKVVRFKWLMNVYLHCIFVTGRSIKSFAVILSFGESGLFFIVIVMIHSCVYLLYNEYSNKEEKWRRTKAVCARKELEKQVQWRKNNATEKT